MNSVTKSSAFLKTNFLKNLQKQSKHFADVTGVNILFSFLGSTTIACSV